MDRPARRLRPPALLTLEVGSLLVKIAVPISGQLWLKLAFDPFLAGLVGLVVLLCAMQGLAALHRAGGLLRASGVVLLVGLGACIAMALRFPFSPERPQRLWLEHREQNGVATLTVEASDFMGLSLLGSIKPASPTPALGLTPPEVEILSSREEGEVRKVTFRLKAHGGDTVLLKIPRRALAGWSLSDRLPEIGTAERYELRVRAPAAQGWEATFHLQGKAPVPVEVHELTATTTPEMRALQAKLPAWTTTHSQVVRVAMLRL